MNKQNTNFTLSLISVSLSVRIKIKIYVLNNKYQLKYIYTLCTIFTNQKLDSSN